MATTCRMDSIAAIREFLPDANRRITIHLVDHCCCSISCGNYSKLIKLLFQMVIDSFHCDACELKQCVIKSYHSFWIILYNDIFWQYFWQYLWQYLCFCLLCVVLFWVFFASDAFNLIIVIPGGISFSSLGCLTAVLQLLLSFIVK